MHCLVLAVVAGIVVLDVMLLYALFCEQGGAMVLELYLVVMRDLPESIDKR